MIMTRELEELGRAIAAALPATVLDQNIEFGQLVLQVEANSIPAILSHLRDHATCEFKVLIDICGVDWPQRQRRFEVVYHLLSLTKNKRIRVKVSVGEGASVPSAVALFPAANWFERETFDMFGITFSDHPDLRRLLTDYGFSGYPMRKDFPLTGYSEVRYDEELKRVVYQPVQLVQEFRDFDFMSPWEGARYVLPGDEKASKDKS